MHDCPQVVARVESHPNAVALLDLRQATLGERENATECLVGRGRRCLRANRAKIT
jgi:hypothetical protein